MAPAPAVAFLDVNETLSDPAVLGERFEHVGAPRYLLPTWFASTLRDGIALAASGDYAEFQDVAHAVPSYAARRGPATERAAGEGRRAHHRRDRRRLPVHPDVPPGIRALNEAGVRIATLTNGGAAVAKGLLERSGLDGLVERNLTVAEVRRWKPPPSPTGTPAAPWASRRATQS